MSEPASARAKPASIPPSPVMVAGLGWVLPGLGYWLIGERWRGVLAGVTILLLFVAGLLIGGARVVDVPGYSGNGFPVGTDPKLSSAQKAAAANRSFLQLTFDKAWYIPQLLTGPVTLAASAWSINQAQAHIDRATSRLWDIGTLYTAVAGMLNLFILIDAAHRSAKAREKDPRLLRM